MLNVFVSIILFVAKVVFVVLFFVDKSRRILFLHFRLTFLSAGYFAGQFNAILDFFVVAVEKVRSVELFLVFHLLFAGGGSFCRLFVLTFCCLQVVGAGEERSCNTLAWSKLRW